MAGVFKLALLQFPSGRWGFVGSVPMKLALVTKDGKTPTEEQFASAAHVGPRIAGLKERVWETKEAALKSAKKEGYAKSKISVHPRTKNPYLGDAVERAKKKRKIPPPLPKHLRGKKNPVADKFLRGRWKAASDAELREEIAELREYIREDKAALRKIGKRPTYQELVEAQPMMLQEDIAEREEDIRTIQGILESRKAGRAAAREATKPKPMKHVVVRRRGVEKVRSNPKKRTKNPSLRSIMMKASK